MSLIMQNDILWQNDSTISVYVSGNVKLNPFIKSGIFYSDILGYFICYLGVSVLIFLSYVLLHIHLSYTNSVEHVQTPRSAMSDLDLHCLSVSRLWETMHK